ncbi:hypothetical protein DESUT3_32900 [Desulfuromonas versatilis]|uniref:Uncharacterized protein n=1 Tax=Desulfuromonas versatilis TaxID=2802975 RepID=A0ABN6E5G5_9BACT|nr:hypothetical protein [Desulfuromonas versatilis]BCR06221.1 hypothetical protein DESUT3_32900 [Desulfuromonas versatilis]
MNALKNLLKVCAVLAAVSLLAFGLYRVGKKEHSPSKYSHPITRPGGHW